MASRVSIRMALMRGDLDIANRCLGYEYCLEGEVVGLVGCDGKVYEDGELSPYVGRTDAKGMVHDSVDDNHIVARVEGEPKQHAGAAFLLLKDELMNPLPF